MSLEILESLTVPEPNSGCLLWLGNLFKGYPVHPDFKTTPRGFPLISRWVIRNISCEEIDGLHACHKCHTPLCVEPTHLYAGTNQQNRDDSKQRGTFWNIHKARDEQWARQTPEERRKRTANGADGVRDWMGRLTQEQRTAIAKRAAHKRWGTPVPAAVQAVLATLPPSSWS